EHQPARTSDRGARDRKVFTFNLKVGTLRCGVRRGGSRSNTRTPQRGDPTYGKLLLRLGTSATLPTRARARANPRRGQSRSRLSFSLQAPAPGSRSPSPPLRATEFSRG